MAVESPHTFERRALLKGVGIGVAGLITGYASRPVEQRIDADIERYTGLKSGDLWGDEQRAKPSSLQDAAVQSVTEEVIFRAVPAFSASWKGISRIDEPIKDVAIGVSSDHALTTRRELLTGAVTSLAYGLSSNVVGGGIRDDRVPVSPTVRGIALWFLQRKFGIFANTSANFLTKRPF